MSMKILSTLLLLFVCVSSAACHPSRSRMCCTRVTTLNMSPEVVGETYRVQASSHPCVKAIIFNTEYGQLCADPNAQWVKDLTANMTKV